MHLLSLLAAGEAVGSETESIWLIIIVILIAAIFIGFASRLSNLDKMIKMLNEKVNNLEKMVTKLKKDVEKKAAKDKANILLNKNVITDGPFTEDTVRDPEELIDTTPKISRLLDPRIKPKDKDKKEDKGKG